jgi:hypothetical protein
MLLIGPTLFVGILVDKQTISGMKELFVVGAAVHGRGQVIFKWDPTCKYLASCGIYLFIYTTLPTILPALACDHIDMSTYEYRSESSSTGSRSKW